MDGIYMSAEIYKNLVEFLQGKVADYIRVLDDPFATRSEIADLQSDAEIARKLLKELHEPEELDY